MNNPVVRFITIERELKEEDIHFGLEEIVIIDRCYSNIDNLTITEYYNLKTIRIGEKSLMNAKHIVLHSII